MKFGRFVLFLAFSFQVAACGSHSSTNASATASTATAGVAAATAPAPAVDSDQIKEDALKNVSIANANDPVCNMPLHNNTGDTTTYNKQTIGFCSKECKDEFLKDPAKHKIKMK